MTLKLHTRYLGVYETTYRHCGRVSTHYHHCIRNGHRLEVMEGVPGESMGLASLPINVFNISDLE